MSLSSSSSAVPPSLPPSLLHLPAHARLVHASGRLQALHVARRRLHPIQQSHKHRAWPLRKDVEGRQGLFVGMRRVAQHAVVHFLEFFCGDLGGFLVGGGVLLGLWVGEKGGRQAGRERMRRCDEDEERERMERAKGGTERRRTQRASILQLQSTSTRTVGMWRRVLELPSGTTKARKWELEQDTGSAAWAVVVPASHAKDRKAPAALLRVIIVVSLVLPVSCGGGRGLREWAGTGSAGRTQATPRVRSNDDGACWAVNVGR